MKFSIESRKYQLFILFGILVHLSCQRTHLHQVYVDHHQAYSEFGPLVFPSAHPDQIILNLTATPEQSIAVNWRTDTTVETSSVEYAIETHGPSFRDHIMNIPAHTEFFVNQYDGEPEVKAHYHSATIEGLTPGETYVYRVGKDETWSEWFQFKIPNSTKDGISLVYFGDAQNEVKSMWSRVIREAYSTLPTVDFMLHAGDLINRSNRDMEWAEWFHAGGFIHSTIPSVMTPGNHEYKNVVLSPQWKPSFNLPTNGPKGLAETCYQVNYPTLKVVSLDGEQIDESPSFQKAQMEWLDSILTHDPRKWTAITMHYPLYSTKVNRDNPALREAFKPIFDKHKVDILLQGHDHAYGRGMVNNESSGSTMQDKKTGTMYVVSVSGPKMYDVGDKSWMDRRASNTQLFQVIQIKDDVLSYDAYTVRGSVYDAFDLVKVPGKANQLVERKPELEERIINRAK